MESVSLIVDRIVERWPVVLACLLASIVAGVYPHVRNWLNIYKIPIIGSELGSTDKLRQAYLGGARKLYNDGYNKVRLKYSFRKCAAWCSNSRCSTVQGWNVPNHHPEE